MPLFPQLTFSLFWTLGSSCPACTIVVNRVLKDSTSSSVFVITIDLCSCSLFIWLILVCWSMIPAGYTSYCRRRRKYISMAAKIFWNIWMGGRGLGYILCIWRSNFHVTQYLWQQQYCNKYIIDTLACDGVLQQCSMHISYCSVVCACMPNWCIQGPSQLHSSLWTG